MPVIIAVKTADLRACNYLITLVISVLFPKKTPRTPSGSPNSREFPTIVPLSVRDLRSTGYRLPSLDWRVGAIHPIPRLIGRHDLFFPLGGLHLEIWTNTPYSAFGPRGTHVPSPLPKGGGRAQRQSCNGKMHGLCTFEIRPCGKSRDNPGHP